MNNFNDHLNFLNNIHDNKTVRQNIENYKQLSENLEKKYQTLLNEVESHVAVASPNAGIEGDPNFAHIKGVEPIGVAYTGEISNYDEWQNMNHTLLNWVGLLNSSWPIGNPALWRTFVGDWNQLILNWGSYSPKEQQTRYNNLYNRWVNGYPGHPGWGALLNKPWPSNIASQYNKDGTYRCANGQTPGSSNCSGS
jgi:hypothetical protein